MPIPGNRLLPALLCFVWAFGGTGSAQAPIDICSLVTEAEAEAIMNKPLDPPKRRPGGDCWFGEDLALYILPVSPASRAEFDALIKEEVDKLNARMREIGAKESPLEPVPDLDAPAYYVDPSLFVYRNKKVLAILADRPQAVAIAAKALTRWK